MYTYVKWVAFPIKKFEAHYIFTKLKPPTIHLPTTHLIITYVTTNLLPTQKLPIGQLININPKPTYH